MIKIINNIGRDYRFGMGYSSSSVLHAKPLKKGENELTIDEFKTLSTVKAFIKLTSEDYNGCFVWKFDKVFSKDDKRETRTANLSTPKKEMDNLKEYGVKQKMKKFEILMKNEKTGEDEKVSLEEATKRLTPKIKPIKQDNLET